MSQKKNVQYILDVKARHLQIAPIGIRPALRCPYECDGQLDESSYKMLFRGTSSADPLAEIFMCEHADSRLRCDCITTRKSCPLIIRRVMLSKLSILKSIRWRLNFLPLPRWMSVLRGTSSRNRLTRFWWRTQSLIMTERKYSTKFLLWMKTRGLINWIWPRRPVMGATT